MNKYIYIRHGEKAYANGKGPSSLPAHDPPLTEKGRREAQEFFLSLLREKGIPDAIWSSPFLRARETAEIAWTVIFEKTGIEIPFYAVPDLGEYLGNQSTVTIELDENTRKWRPPLRENWKQLSRRVLRHWQETRSDYPRKKIWIITHGIFIEILSKLVNHPLRSPPYLGTLTIDS